MHTDLGYRGGTLRVDHSYSLEAWSQVHHLTTERAVICHEDTGMTAAKCERTLTWTACTLRRTLRQCVGLGHIWSLRHLCQTCFDSTAADLRSDVSFLIFGAQQGHVMHFANAGSTHVLASLLSQVPTSRSQVIGPPSDSCPPRRTGLMHRPARRSLCL